MRIHVRLLHYAKKKFTYSVPSNLGNEISLGTIVQVPLGNRVVPAIVDSFVSKNQKFAFEIKSISSVYPFPQDKNYQGFIHKISRYYQVDSLLFLRRVQNFLQEAEKKVDLVSLNEKRSEPKSVVLSEQQQTVYQEVAHSIQQRTPQTFVLHGVTGSGKTEVYKKLIADVIAQKQSVILLLPEVSLALQFEKIIQEAFCKEVVIGFHSGSTVKQKRLLWHSLLQKTPMVIIGVHLPVLLPIANLGLVIVDEEHESGYQEKKHPKLHSRDMALLKAAMYKVSIVLGSATPSVQSLWNVKHRDWKLLALRERFAGKFPQIEIASLKDKKKRKNFWITDLLYKELELCLQRKEQAIVFLNRRGHSFFVQCPCSYVFECLSCSVSLTLHSDSSLLCHYCGYQEKLSQRCPGCQGHHEEFLKKGIGTQQVVQILQRLFPHATIARADADTTVKKRSWQQTVQDMVEGDIDILVGTQSVTKGYHFPGVTLVGILWADLGLHFPMYNAVESTLQQLIQVAGRAGRQSESSKVVVQTFDDHSLYNFVDEQNYLQFYEQEIQKRKEVGYPPYKHIAEIEVRHKEQSVVERDALQLVAEFSNHSLSGDQVEVLGPVQAIVYKVKGMFAQKIILKSMSRSCLVALFQDCNAVARKSSLFFTIDPVS